MIFALKMNRKYHVYGDYAPGIRWRARAIPRRATTDQRLADDVLQVLDSLNIQKPILVGHSLAGSEMTTLGSQHSDRLAGLVYLDAGDDPGATIRERTRRIQCPLSRIWVSPPCALLLPAMRIRNPFGDKRMVLADDEVYVSRS